ncbi:MAG: putative metal-binding motif-containing protein [Alphaproteobacteria bacterium]|nr:putative metal-binding motif-containing protein [Alphaproteobacteria bacterium]
MHGRRALTLALLALTAAGCDAEDCKGADRWYEDRDGDGFGSDRETDASCDPIEGWSRSDADCDDDDATAYPGAAEDCDDEADHNCDGLPRDGCPQSTDPELDPEPEQCDGLDNDGDGLVDEGLTGPWYPDEDGDGYGTPEEAEDCLEESEQGGWASNPDDCDDADPSVGDGVWYADADGDGYGDPEVTWADCAGAPEGYVGNGDDCDDSDAGVWPGASERCDGHPNDCNAEGWTSSDEGGLVAFRRASDGVWTDLTSTFAVGHAGNVIAHEIDRSGELYICEGTWYVELYATANEVSILGPAGSGATTLDAGQGGLRRLITADTSLQLNNDVLTVEGFTLRGGHVEAPEISGYGGCLVAWSPTRVTLRDLVMEDCTADRGGGMTLSARNGELSMDATIVDVEIRDCMAYDDGGGAYIVNGGERTAAGLWIHDNEVISGTGGGLHAGGLSCMSSSESATTYGCLIEDNISGGNGGGVYMRRDGLLEDSILAGNRSGAGGGGLYAYGGIDILSSEITDNVAGRDGGGAYLMDDANLNGVTLSGNEAADEGGGLFLYGNISLVDTEVRDSYAGGTGGGAYLYLGSLNLERVTLSGNQTGGYGGGLHLRESDRDITGTDVTVEGNTAYGGGGVYSDGPVLDWQGAVFRDNTSTDDPGGALYLHYTGATFEDSLFESSYSGGGAAILFTPSNGSAGVQTTLELIDTQVTNNTAGNADGTEGIVSRGAGTLRCTGTAGTSPRYGVFGHAGRAVTITDSSDTFTVELDNCDFGDPSDGSENGTDLTCWTSASSDDTVDLGDDEATTILCPEP